MEHVWRGAAGEGGVMDRLWVWMHRKRIVRQEEPGLLMPNWYGLCWVDYSRRLVVVAVVPLNLVLRFGWWARWAVKCPRRFNPNDKMAMCPECGKRHQHVHQWYVWDSKASPPMWLTRR